MANAHAPMRGTPACDLSSQLGQWIEYALRTGAVVEIRPPICKPGSRVLIDLSSEDAASLPSPRDLPWAVQPDRSAA